ncbi:MAG: hypothetical protein PUB20_03145 [Clostridia bacterium]|nr:hypothetical protein [Clostridia bacterium]
MNPFKVNIILKECKKDGKRVTVDMLSQKCGSRIRHKYLRMSKEMFECEENDGFPRHWVLGLNLRGWLFLWTSHPKSRFDTVAVGDPTEIEDEK